MQFALKNTPRHLFSVSISTHNDDFFLSQEKVETLPKEIQEALITINEFEEGESFKLPLREWEFIKWLYSLKEGAFREAKIKTLFSKEVGDPDTYIYEVPSFSDSYITVIRD